MREQDESEGDFFPFIVSFLFTILVLLGVILFLSVFDVYGFGTMLGIQ